MPLKKYSDKNWIDLSNLPTTSIGIDWKNSIGIPIHFCYREHNGEFYISSVLDSDYVDVIFNNQHFKMAKASIKKCILGRMFDFGCPNNFKYDSGDIIYTNSGGFKIVYRKRFGKVKGYIAECIKCHNSFNIREGNIKKGDGCPYCSNHKVLKGFNDIWTTDPKLGELLVKKNDGYKYTKESNKKVEFKCPRCGSYLGYKMIYDVYKYGISCPKCGDGISYPNKFMFNFLTQLNLDFECEKRFNWCTFPSFEDNNKFIFGRYDFYLPQLHLIIEMDSGLGHGHKVFVSHHSMTKEEAVYRDNYKDKLAKAHGLEIIRIDCQYYDELGKFDACKNGIINSKLKQLFDLSVVNWEQVDISSQKSVVFKVCDMYNAGMSPTDISKKIKLHITTVIDYLKKCELLKLCDYESHRIRR